MLNLFQLFRGKLGYSSKQEEIDWPHRNKVKAKNRRRRKLRKLQQKAVRRKGRK